MKDKVREQPAYYAIIPAVVRYDPNLPPNAKLLYGEITALASKEGFCWASNQYFADLYGLTKTSVSTLVGKLNSRGYIRALTIDENSRHIYITGLAEKSQGVTKKQQGGLRKIARGDSEKSKHSNTVSNTENNTSNTGASPEEISSVIDAFSVANKSFKLWYKRKDQREAVTRLIFHYGLEHVLVAVGVALKSNGIPYFPIITTPVQLEQKWTHLEASLQRKKTENSKPKML